MNSTEDMLTSKQRYTTITLDMGYTLVDLSREYDHELVRLAARAGQQITLADVRDAMRRFWQDQTQRDASATWEPSPAADRAMSLEIDRRICLHLGLTDPQLHAEANAIGQRLFHDPAHFTVYPEVFAALAALRRTGATLGIVSNWGWHLVELCEALGLAPYFDFIISSAHVGASKPHPAIFRAALAQAARAGAGSDPAHTLHAGDSLQADVLGAQALGITGILLDRSGKLRAPNGCVVVNRLDQLVDLLAA